VGRVTVNTHGADHKAAFDDTLAVDRDRIFFPHAGIIFFPERRDASEFMALPAKLR